MKIEKNYKVILTIIILSISIVMGTTVILEDNNTNQKKELKELTIRNWDTEPHNVDIVIEKNEEIRYWESISLNSTSENQNNTTEFDHTEVEKDILGGDITRYKVFVKIGSDGHIKRYEFTDRPTSSVIDSCGKKEHLMIAITIRAADDLRYSVTCEKE